MKTAIKRKGKILACGLLIGFICAGISWAATTVPTATYLGVIGEGLGKPGQAAVDFKNNLYVTYPLERIIRVFSPQGALINTLGIAANGTNLFNHPTSVAVDLTGKVFVGDDNQVVVLDLKDSNYIAYLGMGAGEFLAVQGIALYNPYSYDSSTEPAFMAPDPDAGKTPLVLVADSFGGLNFIKAYRLENNNYVKKAQLNLPANGLCTGITVDNGNVNPLLSKKIIVTDKMNYKVYEYYIKDIALPAPTYQFYKYSGMISGIPDLVGAAVDTMGRLYFALGVISKIQANDRTNNGAKLSTIGTIGKGAGQMQNPSGLLIDFHKRLIISDYSNSRLDLFQLDAGPSTVFSAPDRPVLVDPLNKMVGTQPPLSITNLYECNGNPVDYSIEISTSQDFGSLAQTFVGSVAPPVYDATVSDWAGAALAAPQQYFWRTKAKNQALPDLQSDYSDVGTFFVNTLQSDRPPAAPLLKAPANRAAVDGEDYLEWYPALDPDVFDTLAYTVEILTTSRRPVIVTQALVSSATSIKVKTFPEYNNLRQGTSYYWQVKATDFYGATSAYSEKRIIKILHTGVRIKGLPGSLVYTDGNDAYLGQYQGVIPSSGYFVAELKTGYRVVRLQKAGYNPYYASVKVVPNLILTLFSRQTPVAVPLGNSTLTLPAPVTLPLDYHPQGARPLVIDWQGDGVKELLLGESNGNLTLLSPAKTASPQFQSPVLLANIGSAAAPFVVDWDNDGVNDILVGEGSGLIRRYASKEALAANNYTYLQAWHGDYISVPAGPAVPWVVDWNGDGKKDLLVGAGDGFIYLFINGDYGTDDNPQLIPSGRVQMLDVNGSPTNLIAAAGLTNAAPLTIFWDTDGYMDLVVGYNDGRVYLFKNEPDINYPNNPVFYADAITAITAAGGADIKGYVGSGTSPFAVIWKWGSDLRLDLLLGSDNNGLWATMLSDL